MIDSNVAKQSSAIILGNGEVIHTIVNVGQTIDLGLNQNKWNSNNTYRSYRNTIDNFFEFTFGCSHNDVTPQQIGSINSIFTNEYINYLKTKGNINRTIKQKLSALKQMATWLKKSGFDIDPFVFEPFAKIKDNSDNSYEAFEEMEMYKMIEKAKEYENGEMKSLLIKLAFETAFRKTALLSLKRENFITKNNRCLVWVYDKGNKKDVKPVDEKLFKYIMETTEKYPKALLFRSRDDKKKPMSQRAAERLIIKLKKDLGIDNKKKVFHSIKKASINRIERLSGGDLSLMKRHGNHSSAATTINHYYKSDKEDEIYYALMQGNGVPDISPVEEATMKEIIEAIKLSSARVQFEIIANLKENKEETK